MRRAIRKTTVPTDKLGRRRVNLHEVSVHEAHQAYAAETTEDGQSDDDKFEDANDGSGNNNIDVHKSESTTRGSSSYQVNHFSTEDSNKAFGERVIAMAKSDPRHPADISRVMSSSQSRQAKEKALAEARKVKFDVNMSDIIYSVGTHSQSKYSKHSLIDRGANGGVAGSDVRIVDLYPPSKSVDIQGIDNHRVTDMRLGTVGGVINSQKGPVIALMHNYAIYGKGHSIHCAGQWEMLGCDVNDKSVKVSGGLQRITTPDGYIFPLQFVRGLARLAMRPYTDEEWETLPHVEVCNRNDWNPEVLDYAHTDTSYFEPEDVEDDSPYYNDFDAFGNYRFRVAVQNAEMFSGDFLENPADMDVAIHQCIFDAHIDGYEVMEQELARFDPVAFYDINTFDFDGNLDPDPPDPFEELPPNIDCLLYTSPSPRD